MTAPDYLKRILGARVYDVAIESPLEFAPNLSKLPCSHSLKWSYPHN